jgi:hypothetical protein
MKNMDTCKWIQEAEFQCDVTKEFFKFTDLHIAWYDKSVITDKETTVYHDNFMLVKQGEGFKKLNNRIGDNWSLSSRPLKTVLEENVVLFFTDFLVVDSIHDKGNFKKETNLKSWTELFRRLTILNYELARHRLNEAKQMEDFLEFSEYQLLQGANLEKFIKSL